MINFNKYFYFYYKICASNYWDARMEFAQLIFGVEHKYFNFKMIGGIGICGSPDLRWIWP